MLHFGAFVTESSGHFSEYVPYFRKRPDLIKRYTRKGYLGESGFYANNWPSWRAAAAETIRAVLAGKSEIALKRSSEYASTIVEAMETGRPAVIHGNVLNAGLIDNLPAGGLCRGGGAGRRHRPASRSALGRCRRSWPRSTQRTCTSTS